MERIVRVDAHLTDIGRMPEFDQVYHRYFPNGAFPARTCTQSAGLAGGSSLEVTAGGIARASAAGRYPVIETEAAAADGATIAQTSRATHLGR